MGERGSFLIYKVQIGGILIGSFLISDSHVSCFGAVVSRRKKLQILPDIDKKTGNFQGKFIY